MRSAHLVAGAGGMFCGACLHGQTLVRALAAAGHDAVLLPLYTPLRSEGPAPAAGPLFYGGLNVYLHQHLPGWGKLPARWRRLLDRPGLVRAMSALAGRTRPEQLGPLCVSVLRGEHGRQRAELETLLDGLAALRPDLVHLSTLLLIGAAPQIRRRLGVPVIATLAGEDLFLSQLPPAHRVAALEAIRERLAHVDRLVALSGYHAECMSRLLECPLERITVVRPGLDLAGYRMLPEPSEAEAVLPPSSAVIGYFARVSPEKGLHVLAEAFAQLATDPAMADVKLHAAGYLAPADRPYLAHIQTDLARRGLSDRFQYAGELDREAKIRFLQAADVFCVPAAYPESKGLYLLEAWAAGLPAVLPAHGVFPEWLEATGGGLACPPHDAAALAAGLRQLLADRQRGRVLGRQAQQVVHRQFTDSRLAEETLALYGAVLESSRSA